MIALIFEVQKLQESKTKILKNWNRDHDIFIIRHSKKRFFLPGNLIIVPFILL